MHSDGQPPDLAKEHSFSCFCCTYFSGYYSITSCVQSDISQHTHACLNMTDLNILNIFFLLKHMQIPMFMFSCKVYFLTLDVTSYTFSFTPPPKKKKKQLSSVVVQFFAYFVCFLREEFDCAEFERSCWDTLYFAVKERLEQVLYGCFLNIHI